MESLKIVTFAVLASVTYGVFQDHVTARVCLEYFTIGHLLLFATDDPTLLGLGWGIIATWWVGLPLGFFLAASARAGCRPELTARELIRAIGTLMVAVGLLAGFAGVAGFCRRPGLGPVAGADGVQGAAGQGHREGSRRLVL